MLLNIRTMFILLILVAVPTSYCAGKIPMLKTLQVTRLSSYPVEVSYSIDEIGVLDKTQRIYYVLSIKFKNVGNERVSFLVDKLAIIDKSGVVYHPLNYYDIPKEVRAVVKLPTFFAVELYPNSERTLNFVFSKIPKEGKLYFEVYGTDIQNPFEKLESVNIEFTYSGK